MYLVNLLNVCAGKSLYVHKRTLTWGLEIECDQLGAAEPHGKWVVVG